MKMDLTQNFCIVGTGAFAREVLCCLIDVFKHQNVLHHEKIFFLDHDGKGVKNELLGFKVLQMSDFDPKKYLCLIGIGKPAVREFVVNDLPSEVKYATLVHPSVVLSEWVEIGEGSIVTAGCILTCQIKLGKHVHLNLNTTVGHDVELGDYFTSATMVSVSGCCKVGKGVYFGSNSAVKQGLEVCDNVTVGMGAMVVKSIDTPGTYVGVPAHKLDF